MANFTKLSALGGVAAILAAPALAQDIRGWDANSDGLLDRNEFSTGFSAQAGFGDWDSDADGALTEQEFGDAVYSQYDRDTTDAIEGSEFESARTDFGTDGLWSTRDVTNVQTVDSSGATADVNAGQSLGFENWDANADGVLERSEFQAGFGEGNTFAGFDADVDGRVTQDEFAQGVFDRYDADRSGMIEDPELAEIEADMGDEGFWNS